MSNTVNPHLAIWGQSGTGKSTLMKKLLIQAANQGALCLILDYSSDFQDFTPPENLPCQHIDVTAPTFKLNPLAGLPGQSPDARAQRLLASFHSVFQMGPRADLALRQITPEYLAENGAPTLDGLLAHIVNVENPGRGLEAAKEPLELLASLVHCGKEPINLDLGTPGLIVLDFSKIYDQSLCRLLVEISLQALWTSHTVNQPPLILVLDEAQSLAWRQGSMAIRILREGRKFGIAGWFASQWIDNKNAVAALGQASLQAHFCPDGEHLNKLAKSFCSTHPSDLPRYRRLIQGLRCGQFIWQLPDGRQVVVNVEHD